MTAHSPQVIEAALRRNFGPIASQEERSRGSRANAEVVRDAYLQAGALLITACGSEAVSAGGGTAIPFGMLYTLGERMSGHSPSFVCSSGSQANTGEAIIHYVRDRVRGAEGMTIGAASAFETRPTSPVALGSAFEILATEASSEERPAATSRPWLIAAYELSRQGRGRYALQLVYRAVENYIRDQKFDELDQVLSGVDVSQLSPQVSSGLLRVASRVRKALPNWGPLVERVRQELNRKAVANATALLSGLD